MTWLQLVLLAAACVAVSAAGTALFRRWAHARQLLDVPNARSSHTVPTPRGAGVIIGLTVASALHLASMASAISASRAGTVIALAALVIAKVSAIDDVRGVATGVRLAVHVAGAVAAVTAIGLSVASLQWVVAVLWIVGLTNAYNFMDGIDGIAGAQAVVAGTTVAAVGVIASSPGVATAGAAIAGAAAGFLVHNWAPARVFMGDVGSAFLGFTLASIALVLWNSDRALALPVVASLWPFIFDTSATFLRRAARRENVLTAHRSHLYQRLVAAGSSHATVAGAYAAAAIVSAAAAFASVVVGIHAAWLALPAIASGIWLLVRRREASIRLRSIASG